jgi:glycine betaine/proline transport system substrate-binding protein
MLFYDRERSFFVKEFTKNVLAVIGVIFAILVLLGAVRPSFGDDGKVVFADFSWESVQFHNRVAGFLIENGWDRDVEYMFVEEIPGFMGLERGDLQITMEAWVDNSASYWEKAEKRGEVVSLGKNYPDAPQGWYVPTYVIKGDASRGIAPLAPDLKSVSDLARYWKLFRDPENKDKGRFNNGPSGWIVSVTNGKRLKAYGLDDRFVNFYTGSAAALAASIAGACEKGQPVLAYYWEPTPILGMYDMTKLEEPPYDEAVWNDTGACAFPKCRVLKVANKEFLDGSPEIRGMIERYHTSLELTNGAMAYMKKNSLGPAETAEWFLKTHPELWKAWVADPEAVKRIARALD